MKNDIFLITKVANWQYRTNAADFTCNENHTHASTSFFVFLSVKYALVGFLLYLLIKYPIVNIFAFVIGFMLVQAIIILKVMGRSLIAVNEKIN